MLLVVVLIDSGDWLQMEHRGVDTMVKVDLGRRRTTTTV